VTRVCRYEEELLALQNFQRKRLKLEEDLVEAKTFIENERARHKSALQVDKHSVPKQSLVRST
jgi:hypothetical protein